MANIFISHSSKDNDSASEILGSLQEIGSSIFLDFDKLHGLKGGQKWEKELYVRVKKSRIMIVTISPNWLDSTWCYKEYCMARVLRKNIIPVIIEQDARIEKWDGKDLQHYDTAIDDEAIDKLQGRVQELTHSDLTKLYNPEKLKSPFPGLRSFNKDEASVFHGRTDDTLRAVDMLNGMVDGSEKLLNIIGASGVGKSSFLKAGVLPFVELLHTDLWHVLPVFRAKQELLLNLAKVLASTSNSKSSEILAKLRKSEFQELFEELELNAYDTAKEDNDEIEDVKILLPIDQAEEILSTSNQKERDQFISILKYLLEEKSNFYVVWTLRADYLKKYQDDKALEFLHQLETTLLLKPISSKEIKNIIQEPAFSADILIDEAVVEEIKENISSILSLPILAYLLQTLFVVAKSEKRKRITLNDYNALSKDGKNPIENIINESANAIYNRVEDKELIKELFLSHLIKVNIDESIIKQSAKLENVAIGIHSTIEQFVDKRLFVKDRDSNNLITIEIAHEALINSWENLAEWIEEEREFLVFKSHLNFFYNEWLGADSDDKALLSGLSLEKAILFKDQLKDDDEIEFIDKSIKYSEEQEKRFEELYETAQNQLYKTTMQQGRIYRDYINDTYSAKLYFSKAADISKNLEDYQQALFSYQNILRPKLIKEFDFIYLAKCILSEDKSKVILYGEGLIEPYGKITIYDCEKNQDYSLEYDNRIRWATLIHNDQFILSRDTEDQIEITNISNEDERVSIYHEGVYKIYISKDNNKILSYAKDNIKIFSINGKLLFTRPYYYKIKNLLYFEKKELIISYNDSTKNIYIFSFSGKLLYSLSFLSSIKDICFASKINMIIAYDSNCLYMISPNGNVVTKIEYPSIVGITISKDEKTIGIYGVNQILLYSTDTFQKEYLMHDNIKGLYVEKDNDLIISYSSNILKIFHLDNKKEISIPCPNNLQNIKYFRDKNFIIYYDDKGLLKCISLDGEEIFTIQHHKAIHDVLIKDNKLLSYDINGELKISSIQGMLITNVKLDNMIKNIIYLDDKKRFLVYSRNKFVDFSLSDRIKTINHCNSKISSLTQCDKNNIAYIVKDGIYIYRNNKNIIPLPYINAQRIFSLSNQNMIIDLNDKIILLDPALKEILFINKTKNQKILPLKNNFICYGGTNNAEGIINVYNNYGIFVYSIEHKGWVSGVKYLYDKNILVSYTRNGEIKIFKIDTKNVVTLNLDDLIENITFSYNKQNIMMHHYNNAQSKYTIDGDIKYKSSHEYYGFTEIDDTWWMGYNNKELYTGAYGGENHHMIPMPYHYNNLGDTITKIIYSSYDFGRIIVILEGGDVIIADVYTEIKYRLQLHSVNIENIVLFDHFKKMISYDINGEIKIVNLEGYIEATYHNEASISNLIVDEKNKKIVFSSDEFLKCIELNIDTTIEENFLEEDGFEKEFLASHI